MNTKQSTANWGYMNPDDLPQSLETPVGRGKLAICIPTYRRADVVEELLKTSMDMYSKYRLDVYIYDSSDDDETRLLVERWKEVYSNLYYVHLPSELHSNMKVYKIFQKYSLHKDYDYLWICSDSIRWAEKVLEQVDAQLGNGYDMIVVNYRDKEHLGDREYHDQATFAKECGWHLTLYGAVVLNTHTMLQEVDWKELQRKYNRPERVNHSHVCFYLEKISTLRNFCARHISFPKWVLTASSLKKYSGWRNDTFYVWGYCFPDAINALPDYYNKRVKRAIIKKNGRYADVFDVRNLLALRADGLYDMEIYKEYEKEWKTLTDVPKWKLRKIARMTLEQIQALGQTGLRSKDRIREHKKQLKRLKRFASQYDKIYIYGAGKCAKRYAEYLEKMHIGYEGFVVSDLADNAREINGCPVGEIAELNVKEENTGIVLGLNPYNQHQVKEILKERGITDNIFCEFIGKI